MRVFISEVSTRTQPNDGSGGCIALLVSLFTQHKKKLASGIATRNWFLWFCQNIVRVGYHEARHVRLTICDLSLLWCRRKRKKGVARWWWDAWQLLFCECVANGTAWWEDGWDAIEPNVWFVVTHTGLGVNGNRFRCGMTRLGNDWQHAYPPPKDRSCNYLLLQRIRNWPMMLSKPHTHNSMTFSATPRTSTIVGAAYKFINFKLFFFQRQCSSGKRVSK